MPPCLQKHDALLKQSKAHTSSVGTFSHIAPEVVTGELYGPSCDIFSFGIVLSEFLLAKEAEKLSEIPGLRGVKKGSPFTLNEDKLKECLGDEPLAPRLLIADLAIRCCNLEPESRPCAQDVVDNLKERLTEFVAMASAAPAPTLAARKTKAFDGHVAKITSVRETRSSKRIAAYSNGSKENNINKQ